MSALEAQRRAAAERFAASLVRRREAAAAAKMADATPVIAASGDLTQLARDSPRSPRSDDASMTATDQTLAASAFIGCTSGGEGHDSSGRSLRRCSPEGVTHPTTHR